MTRLLIAYATCALAWRFTLGDFEPGWAAAVKVAILFALGGAIYRAARFVYRKALA